MWLLKALIDVVVVALWTTYRLCRDNNDIPLDTRTHRTGLSRREVVYRQVVFIAVSLTILWKSWCCISGTTRLKMVPAVAGLVLIFLMRITMWKTHTCIRYIDFLTSCFWNQFGGFLYLEIAKLGVQKLTDNLKATSKF